MMKYEDLLALTKALAKADPAAPIAYSCNGTNLSYDALNETARREFNELCSNGDGNFNFNVYEQNRPLIFRIISETIDEVLPKKVEKRYEQFAETKVFAQGDRPSFRKPVNVRNRAKQFITRAGLSGMYEVFKIPANVDEAFEVRTSAIGGAAQVGLEEWLDGRVDFNVLIDIVMSGMDELIYKEVAAALKASINQLPPANRVAVAGFDEDAMDRLIMIASAYGTPVVYCTYEFAVKMIPQQAWRYSSDMKNTLWQNGRFADYKGTRVVILDQGFEDGTNTTKVIDPGYCWVIPTTANGKPVKIAFEGDTILKQRENYDNSTEIQVYKKVGVICILSNDICCYVDTALRGDMTTWHLNGYHAVQDTYG
ncbi:MAG: hypothetical protein HUJ76_12285 [Parasporobacterium sp.]|nr:hypothetical protein [Parasporobacterium sp.]